MYRARQRERLVISTTTFSPGSRGEASRVTYSFISRSSWDTLRGATATSSRFGFATGTGGVQKVFCWVSVTWNTA